ncbi:MAG: conserved membrane protein of unknown function [Nitrosopumilales archaeon]|nr:MAG: conserved membrane protein of unknown function [Nitrosopumilales archaeon]
MSHLGIGPFEFLLLATYPVVALLIIEIVYRFAKFLSWVKLIIQGLVCIAFGIAYVTIIEAHWLTSLVLFALAFVLFYQAKIAKLNPDKSIY